MHIRPWTMRKHVILSSVITAMVFIAKQTVPYLLKHLIMWQYSIEAAKDASSIGIIGGADGPTAIYLSSHKSTYSVFGYLICWLVLLACYKPLNKRINHR